MGLDVYVGSLTRYHSGEWELIAQKIARELGMSIEVVRQHPASGEATDQNEIRERVLAWRDELNDSLSADLGSPLSWDEGPDTPYFTDKPTWDNYMDLPLWAAYDEQERLPRPIEHVEDWSEDEAYQRSSGLNDKSRYSHLFNVSAWLPCEFDFLFDAKDIAGVELRFGSSLKLVSQLHELNGRTWQATPDVVQQWCKEGAEHGAPLELGAKFAFSVFLQLAEQAVHHSLPMRLDW